MPVKAAKSGITRLFDCSQWDAMPAGNLGWTLIQRDCDSETPTARRPYAEVAPPRILPSTQVLAILEQNPITVVTINGISTIGLLTGDVTGGSAKIIITDGTGAAVGGDVIIDIDEAEILLQNLGGLLALTQIAQGGATTGQALMWNGTNWVPDDVTGGDDWGAQVVEVTARISGDGTVGSELDIAQQGATVGQALIWNGSSWAPDDVTGSDDWGAQVVEHGTTLIGDGTSGTPLDVRDVAGFSVLGNSTNVSGEMEDISASSSDEVLRVNSAGTVLGFGQVATGGIANAAVTTGKLGGFTDTKVPYGNSSGGFDQATNFAFDAANELLVIGTTGGSPGQKMRLYNYQSGSDSLVALAIAQRYTGTTASKTHRAIEIVQDDNSTAASNVYNNIYSKLQSNSSAAQPTTFYNMYLESYWSSSNTVNPIGGIYNLVECNNTSAAGNIVGVLNTTRKLSGAGTVNLIQGARFVASHSTTTGSVSEARGFQADVFNSAINVGADMYVYSTQNKASGYVTALRGIRLSLYNNSSYTIAAGYGTDFDFTTNANTAITTLYGHRIVSTNFLGTTQYGFYANLANNGSGSGTNWGVYIQNSDQSYFNKKLCVGTTSSAAMFDVKGAGSGSGTYTAKFSNSGGFTVMVLQDDRKVGILTTPQVTLDVQTATDSIAIPTGTTAQRPAVNASVRMNSDFGGMEVRESGIWKRVTSRTTPTITAGAALGTSPTVSVDSGNDLCHQVTITPGTSPTTGNLFTVNFATALDPASFTFVVFSPASDSAIGVGRLNSAGNTAYTISTPVALMTGTPYTFHIMVKQ